VRGLRTAPQLDSVCPHGLEDTFVKEKLVWKRELETEITSNFVIKVSVFMNILTWINNIFPIGNQEYLPFIIYIPIR